MTLSVTTDDLVLLREWRRRQAARPQVTDPLGWAASQATIVHPTRGRVPFSPYPYQRDFLATWGAPRRYVLKARQIGFSQVFALEALWRSIAHDEVTVLLVSRSQDLAVNLLRYCYQAYNSLRAAPALTKSNESEMGFANGSRLKSIPANRSTGRGFAASAVYLDEFAYAEYADDIYQSVSPSLSQGGHLVIGSTPNGVGNLFHTLSMRDDFVRAVVPWYRCPAYNPQGAELVGDADAKVVGEAGAWYISERPKYTAAQWAAEYECDFVGSGGTVFRPDLIERATGGAAGDTAPVAGRDYLTTVDVGRRNDATVINVIDRTAAPYQRVYHERIERTPYPEIQRRIADAATRYPGLLLVESNGIGDPVIENLDVPAEPFVTTAKSKAQAIQGLVLLLERGDLKARWTAQERRELTHYAWDDARLTQDCVMSLAIAAAVLTRETGWLLA